MVDIKGQYVNLKYFNIQNSNHVDHTQEAAELVSSAWLWWNSMNPFLVRKYMYSMFLVIFTDICLILAF